VQSDGHIDFLAVTPREYPLELIADTGRLTAGRQTTELYLDGVPRLRLVYQVAGNKVRVESFESLGAEPAEDAPKTVADDNPKVEKEPPKEEPSKPPVTDAEWDARDLEGKWILYRKLIRADEKNGQRLVAYLAKRKDFEFLEMIAMHQPLYEGAIGATWALARADAPQWLRLAAWLRPMEVDHGEAETKLLVTKHNPAKALAWLEKYGEEASMAKGEKMLPGLADRVNPLKSDLELLRKKKIKPADLGNALGPLPPAEVFHNLDAPKELSDFGDRLRAQPDKVYVHQVVRAIRTLARSGRYREPWVGKVLQLTKHPHPEVRQEALLAFTFIGPYMDPKTSPVDEFRKTMDDPAEAAVIRESAMVAFSYFRHPQVYVRLHELALETTHPAWRAAISRLNDIGNEFTLEHLTQLDKTKLAKKDVEVLDRNIAALKQWVEDPQRVRSVSRASAEAQLERAVWAELTKSPVRKNLTAWTKSFYANQPDDAFMKPLDEIRKQYEPAYNVPDSGAMTRLVRELARDILSEPRPEK
jgi:hypothetical protein